METAAAVPVCGDHRCPRNDVRAWHFIKQLLSVPQVRITGRVASKEGVADVEIAREAGLGHLGVYGAEFVERGERGEHQREGVAVGADAEADKMAEERER
jgi:hypothetical protein